MAYQPDSHSNLGYNSYRLSAKKTKVLEAVLQSEIELTPIQVAERTGVNHRTVKVYLRELIKEGKIVQPYHGSYCSQITHGMMFAPLRTHNVVLTSDVSWLDFSDDFVEIVGSVKIRVQYGLERRKITGTISSDGGMDKNTIVFALNRFYDLVKARTNHDLETVLVKTFEMNRDYQGVRLDGVKCYTKKGLFDVLERLYQKEENLVRQEYKVSTPMKVDEFMSLIQGGVSSYNMQQGLFMLVQEQKQLVDAVKSNNWQILKVTEVMQKIVERGKQKTFAEMSNMMQLRPIKRMVKVIDRSFQKSILEWMV